MKQTLLDIFQILRDTIKKFGADRAFRHGAAISYYTIFSLPPILIIIINLAGFFMSEALVQNEIFNQMSSILGEESAEQVRTVMQNISKDRNSFWATVLGIGTLIFGATGAFYSLKDSLNTIWGVRSPIRIGFFRILLDRTLSFAMVISFGFILLVSMVVNAVIVAVRNFLNNAMYMQRVNELLNEWFQISDTSLYITYLLNMLVTLVIFSLVFGLIFRFLPDARVHWKDLAAGSVLTAVLFLLGEFVIGWYLGHSDIASMYGAAGSVIIILLWVFYSSQILLLGAEFTQVYAGFHGRKIRPRQYRVKPVQLRMQKWLEGIKLRSAQRKKNPKPPEKSDT